MCVYVALHQAFFRKHGGMCEIGPPTNLIVARFGTHSCARARVRSLRCAALASISENEVSQKPNPNTAHTQTRIHAQTITRCVPELCVCVCLRVPYQSYNNLTTLFRNSFVGQRAGWSVAIEQDNYFCSRSVVVQIWFRNSANAETITMTAIAGFFNLFWPNVLFPIA